MSRILIIDDDPVMLALLKKWLTGAGHEILSATDGESGLQLAATERPEIIITDMMMPRLHGLAVVEKVHANPDLAATKIIVCSVKNYPSDIRAAMELGADASMKLSSCAGS